MTSETVGSLAVVAVAVDDLAAATRRLGNGFASEARAEIAEALRGALRQQDLCSPWREDLVVAIVPGVDVEQAPSLRLRVQRAISELRLVTHAGEEIRLAFQVASACTPEDGASEADLLAAVERRLAHSRPPRPDSPEGVAARLHAAVPIHSN